MRYNVKVSLFDLTIPDLEEDFDYVDINEQSEMLMLFKDVPCQLGNTHKTIRYAIPLNSIESFTINPLYEDNKSKIPSC